MATRADALSQQEDGERNVNPAWSQPLHIATWLIPEGNRWCALSEEFDVVGIGGVPEAACHNMDELLADYLGLVAAEGGSPSDARRPISHLRKARLEALLLRDWVRRHLHAQIEGVRRVDHDTRARAHMAAPLA